MSNLLDSKSTIETDWLSSSSVYYDLSTSSVSKNIRDILPTGSDIRFHPEGLYNFLDFGYSVFGQTPIQDIQILQPAECLQRDSCGRLWLKKLSDPVEKWFNYNLSEDEIFELIRERVQKWENNLSTDQEIVLPLSGGFDSRLLLWCLSDKSRVRAYTYGISGEQNKSTEVVYARYLAEYFGVQWEQIYLGDFHNYFLHWDTEFGLATHAHGMYHIEFYSKIRERIRGNQVLLSGIIGDVWAGSIPYQKLNTASDLSKLSYSHGLRVDPRHLKLPVLHDLRDHFWEVNKIRLGDHRFQVVTSMRFKLTLLTYLMRIPQMFGLQPWSPFLDIDIAMAMLNLPPERRANRKWQHEFFVKIGLDLENQNLKSSRSNNLNYQAMILNPLEPLDVSLLSGLFAKEYLLWINKHIVVTSFSKIRSRILEIRKIGSFLRLMSFKNNNIEAYFAYLCLKPIENCIKQVQT